MINERKQKENKDRSKGKGNRSKITFAELLDKYQKKSEEKSAYRSSSLEASRSPPKISMQHIHVLTLGR